MALWHAGEGRVYQRFEFVARKNQSEASGLNDKATFFVTSKLVSKLVSIWFCDFCKIAITLINKGENVAPQVGFEPTTYRLTAERSTTELLGNIKVCRNILSKKSGLSMIFHIFLQFFLINIVCCISLQECKFDFLCWVPSFVNKKIARERRCQINSHKMQLGFSNHILD